MARGKQTCKILKEIRRQIADANGIEFATSAPGATSISKSPSIPEAQPLLFRKLIIVAPINGSRCVIPLLSLQGRLSRHVPKMRGRGALLGATTSLPSAHGVYFFAHDAFHHKCIGYSMDCNISHWERQVRIRSLRGNAVWI